MPRDPKIDLAVETLSDEVAKIASTRKVPGILEMMPLGAAAKTVIENAAGREFMAKTCAKYFRTSPEAQAFAMTLMTECPELVAFLVRKYGQAVQPAKPAEDVKVRPS
jgi:hypothetical protein